MADPKDNGNDIFSLDNWLPMEPTPDDFISPPLIIWDYPTKEERHKMMKNKWYRKNKEKTRKRSKEWIENNKEKYLKWQRKWQRDWYEKNKEKVAKRLKEYYEKNKEKMLKRRRELRENNKEKYLKREREWREKNKEKMLNRQREWRENNKEKLLKQHRDKKRKIKEIVVNYYSNGLQECACCGVKTNLTVDHINGDGKQHRGEKAFSVHTFYKWLIRNNFPKGFQILCFECNISKHTGTSCKIDHSKDLTQEEKPFLRGQSNPCLL